MYIEYVDQLRCTVEHEESWLVASITKREDRFIVQGTLGCPICRRQYPIIDGVAYFGVARGNDTRVGIPEGEHSTGERGPEEAVRVAAFLNAAERSTLVLAGAWGAHAYAVAGMIPLTAFVLNPPTLVRDSEWVAVIESSEGIPLAHNAVHGVALDRRTATPVNVSTASKVLKAGGRFVAPVEVDPPPWVTVLAQDDVYWVGEKIGEVIPLRRA